MRQRGKPAQWLFAGVRKLTLCKELAKRPSDGTEDSCTEMELDSEQTVCKLLEGKPIALKFRDQFETVARKLGSS